MSNKGNKIDEVPTLSGTTYYVYWNQSIIKAIKLTLLLYLKNRNISLGVLIGLSLTGCVANSPLSEGEKHLELLRLGKNSEANQQYCSIKESLRLLPIKSFEILNSQTKQREGMPYIEITAKIDTKQTVLNSIDVDGVKTHKEQPITQVVFEIWKSDDFYNLSVTNTAKINEVGKKIDTLTGGNSQTLTVPSRGDYNSNSLCVFMPFKQFEND